MMYKTYIGKTIGDTVFMDWLTIKGSLFLKLMCKINVISIKITA